MSDEVETSSGLHQFGLRTWWELIAHAHATCFVGHLQVKMSRYNVSESTKLAHLRHLESAFWYREVSPTLTSDCGLIMEFVVSKGTSERYVQILENAFIPIDQSDPNFDETWFMQNGTRIHRTKKMFNILEDHFGVILLI